MASASTLHNAKPVLPVRNAKFSTNESDLTQKREMRVQLVVPLMAGAQDDSRRDHETGFREQGAAWTRPRESFALYVRLHEGTQ